MPSRIASLMMSAVVLLTGCGSVHVNTPTGGSSSPLTITTTSMPAATVGTPYSATIAASGGAMPYIFTAAGLPSGLTINGSTGVLTGTPAASAAGTATLVLTVTDSTMQTATASLKLTVNAASTSSKLTITTTSLSGGTVSVVYSGAITATGGTTPYTYGATGLPSGLAISGSTGAITGTPTSSSVGTATVSVTVTDSTQPTAQTATATLGLTISAAQASALTIETTTLPSATAGDAYNSAITAAGGATPYTYSATGLPTGLAISAATGAITGTPATSAAGTAMVTSTVTDSTKPTAQTATADLNLTVNAAGSTPACNGMSTGNNASLNGFVPFPSTAAWNTDISNAPLDPNNAAITSGFAGLHLHHDWSSVAGGNYGIPYVVVDSSSTPLVSINVESYATESDVAHAPFPITAPIEGAPADCTGGPGAYAGDQHVLVLDRNTCMLYETFNTVRCKGNWASDSETIWDMQNFEQRPWGWTSADAAGLAIFPGLVRYDEVASGAINHAIRFTMQQTKNDANGGYFVEPASHAAGTVYGVSNVMGMRIRLKASFDISGYSKANQVILTAMKKYGMILADNGSYFYFQGVPDPRWDDDDLHNLDSIASSNFEVVQMTPAWPGYDDATAPTGAPPTINSFAASASTVTAGTPVTLTWNTANDSYDFIDLLGGVRGGSVTFTPTATATYTLNATNQYGRSTSQVTVTVH
ncbi:MAG: putative Ig domain-containing protein [Terracidiphilus sp.]